MKYFLISLITLFCAISVFTQTADVYFYRVKEVHGIDNRYQKIYLGDKDFFEMKQFSWIGFKFKAGTYELRTKKKNTETLFKVEEGKTYFIRISQTVAGFFFSEKIEILTDPEQAIYQMRELNLLDTKKIKNKSFETILEKPKSERSAHH